MTIKELHVGIDLGVQRLDSNIFGNIQSPEKDYYINIVIGQLMRAVVLDEKNAVFSLLTYSDIGEFYEACQAHIVRRTLPLEEMLGQGYIRCKLPQTNISGNVISGNLVSGTYYEVSSIGNTDLTKFGYDLPVKAIGDVFKCVIDDYKYSYDIILVNNGLYKIVNSGGFDFEGTFGAPSNDIGTIFRVSDPNPTRIYNNSSIHLEVLEENPGWSSSNVTALKILSTEDYYLYIKSDSYTEHGGSIGAGILHKGIRYKVITPSIGGPNTNLRHFGGYENNDKGTIFVCTKTDSPNWINGTTLKQVKAQPNRLLKEQDITNARTNSFGTVITSPIVTIRDYGLDVFHDDKFEVDEVQLSYIRKPAKVSLSEDIDTDLPESIHGKLVGLIVAYISADLDPQTYAIQKDKAMTSDDVQQ